jgi:hypothetical protein
MMPQAVLLAAIPAAAAIGGAVVQSRAANKATKASTAANTEALNFTKSQAEAASADYARRYAAWEAERQALFQRYGINIPASAPAGPGAGVPGPQPQGPAMGNSLMRGATIADILGRKQAQPPPDARPLDAWNDWGQRGLRLA